MRRRDIEQLLQWAFRDELPKRMQPAFGPGYVSPLARLVDMGVQIQETAGEPGFPAALGEPDPDALVIEAAVLALQHAPIDWPSTRRDCIGAVGGLLDDNEPTLKHLTIGTPGLVALHAKMRTRPQWDLRPHPEPMLGKNGKPEIRLRDRSGPAVKGKGGPNGVPWYPTGACSFIEWWPVPRLAAFNRIEYSIWWQALDTLADHLRGGLASFEPLNPAAHPSPWVAMN